MKQLFLIALLVLNSGPAYAEWVGFGTGGDDLQFTLTQRLSAAKVI